MPTTITKLPSSTQNLFSELTGAVNWSNTNNITTEDGSVATAAFSSTNTTTNYLFAYDFALEVPSTAVIEGVIARVKKRCFGPVNDSEVYLTYNDGSYPSLSGTNYAHEAPWTSVFIQDIYGGATDLWNFNWTPAVLNDPLFGFVIAASGDGSINNAAYVDYVELTISYHNVFTQLVTGGARVGGSASVSGSQTPPIDVGGVGVWAAGRARLTNDMVSTGGAWLSGAAITTPIGGVFGNGSAIVDVIYSGNIQANEYSFYCEPQQAVPPTPQSTGLLAMCTVWIDPTSGAFWSQVEHNFKFVDEIHFRGPAPFGVQNGPTTITRVALEDQLGITPQPIHIGATIKASDVTDIQKGLWYVQIVNSFANTIVRGQVVNWPLQAGGSASYGQVNTLPSTGGALAGGSATWSYIAAPQPSGGVWANAPDTDHATYNEPIPGALNRGVYANGTGGPSLVPYLPIVGVGTIAGGSAPDPAKFNIQISTSGPKVNGSATKAITLAIGGSGVWANGSAQYLRVYSPTAGGGALAGGTLVLQLTYHSLPVVGGVRVYGETAAEHLLFFTTQREYGVGLQLKSDNILKVPKIHKTVLRKPVNGTTPPVQNQSSPFAQRNQAGWCNFGGPCGSNSAYLPSVVQKRQPNNLPPQDPDTTTAS